MKHELRLFFIALQFLTRVPVPAWVSFEPAWLHASARWFAAVGLLVGVLAASVWWAAAFVFPPAVGAWLVIAATLWLTGGFHEDGWADTCDGLGGAVGRERALEIMKDSRIGAYGAIGLVAMLGLKAATLAAIEPAQVGAALLFAHTASRAAAVALMRWLPYVGAIEHAKLPTLARRTSNAAVAGAMATLLAVACGLAAVAPPGSRRDIAAALVATLVAGWGCGRWFERRLGGVNGDTLGAAQQFTEVGALLTLLATQAHRAGPV